MPKFASVEHEKFFKEIVAQTHTDDDVYRKAMFYALGLTETTRAHVREIYDFEHRCPRFNVMRKAWQTSTSVQVTRLAFNLYNGHDGSGKTDPAGDYSPYYLFACGLMEYMFEAIRIRYPEYTAEAQERTRRMFGELY